ncbi:MAG: xanthine dehydrogenase accessory protein XdhC [Rhodoferax sp.]|nr:xanthine dehydrogenase accessory protein XdhC [Rhodoferax sp.]
MFTELFSLLATQEAVLVTVRAHRGSVPREAGAWMAVFADRLLGTVGGGHLEWQAVQQARADLAAGVVGCAQRRYPLGPALGQCCGGEVELGFERIGAQDVSALQQRFDRQRAAWPPVALFGGGHVGWALVRLLAELPLRLTWIDSRDGIFPPEVPTQVVCEFSQPVQAAVAALAPGSHVLVMSFSHAEDFEVVQACLARQRQRADLPFIGLLGSRTKWATFAHRLQDRGFSPAELAQVTCPVGAPGIGGKQPEVIAVAVAAQLLQVMDRALACDGVNKDG